MKTIDFKR